MRHMIAQHGAGAHGHARADIVRNIPIMGHHSPDGHCEILLRDVRVPVSNLLGRRDRPLP